MNNFFANQLFPYQILKELAANRGRLYFHDFDMDGISERVIVNKQVSSAFYITINNTQQFNAFGDFPEKSFPAFGDYNNNRIGEIYFASYHLDSVFLHAYEYNKENDPVLRNFFIDKVSRYNKDEDFVLEINAEHDFTGDGIDDVLVMINASYTYQPRKLYIVDILADTKRESPVSGAWKQQYAIANLDEDPMPEIVTYGYAPGNTPLDFPYHDHYSWVMMFDNDLSFLNEPIAYTDRPGAVGPWEIQNDTISFFTGNVSDFRTSLVRISNAGKPYDTLPLEIGPGIQYYKVDSASYLHRQNEGTFSRLDDNLIPLEERQLSPNCSYFHSADLDLDGGSELIFRHANGFYIYDRALAHFVSLTIPATIMASANGSVKFSINKLLNGPPQFVVSFAEQNYLFEYSLNPFYQLRWLAFAFVFVLFFAVGWFVIRFIELRRQSIDYQLLLMQVNSLKNQLDPHFTFNLLGSLRGVIERKEWEKSLSAFDQFSHLLKTSLLTSDRIDSTLRDELESARNYLNLQKFRFGEAFDFRITREESVPENLAIPKLLVQTHLENAVKHGVRPLKAGGFIEVKAVRKGKAVEISIIDNGIGRKNAKKYGTAGTGKGMKITQYLIQLFNQLFQTEIIQKVADNVAMKGENVGTRVSILIPLR